MRKFITILFIVFVFTSIQGQYKDLYKSLIDFDVKLTNLYKSGWVIEDCVKQTQHWLDITNKIIFYDRKSYNSFYNVISKSMRLLEPDSDEIVSSFVNYVNTGIKSRDSFYSCAENSYSFHDDSRLCDECNEMARKSLVNHINILYTFVEYLEANKVKYNIEL
ncbi:MAG: hypothetical protein OXC03_02980 [Flavobacteriaceae bacterium]|nr:hypothetical protein [Flavobacteriaceae bacterium]